MRIATLNVQNLRLQEIDGRDFLHGARDSDVPEEVGLDRIDRRLTAELIKETDAEIMALQEVFDLATLDYFHEHFLIPAGTNPYPHRVCINGNDGRGLDVALLSRRNPDAIISHAGLTPEKAGIAVPPSVDPNFPIFRRDCLEVQLGQLSLYLCHYKSPYPDYDKAWTTRRSEAEATRWLIEQRHSDPAKDLWMIIGDLNEPATTESGHSRAIAPLENDFSVDLMLRLPDSDRWTYFDPQRESYHCPDALLASPALATRWPDAIPSIQRMGLGAESARFAGPRLQGVGTHRPHASDHAAIMIDLPGL